MNSISTSQTTKLHWILEIGDDLYAGDAALREATFFQGRLREGNALENIVVPIHESF